MVFGVGDGRPLLSTTVSGYSVMFFVLFSYLTFNRITSLILYSYVFVKVIFFVFTWLYNAILYSYVFVLRL